jgi:hypothetical protein
LPARAPFLWKYLGTDYEMEFVGGLIGVAQEPATLCLRPEIGWAIVDKQTITRLKAEEAAKECARVKAERVKRAKAQVVSPHLERAWRHLSRGEYEAAISSFTEAIRLEPDLPEPYVGRALAHRSLGNEAGALGDERAARERGHTSRK